MTLDQLADEISSDPEGLGFAALLETGSDQGIADALNLTREGEGYLVSRGFVSRAVFVGDCTPLLMRLSQAALLSQDEGVRTLALMWLQTYDRTIPHLELVNTASGSLAEAFDALQAADLMSAEEVADLTLRQGSRAEALWGTGATVTGQDVAAALGRP